MDNGASDTRVSWNASTRLSGARLARTGNPGADALTWTSRLATLALVLAVVWWAWVALRPLPGADEDQAAAPPRIPTIGNNVHDRAPRDVMLESLAAQNLFAADRQTWQRKPDSVTAEAQEQAENLDPAAIAAAAQQAQLAAAISSGAVGPVNFTPTAQLPDDIKKALSALELKAVHADREGRGVARISLVHSPTRQLSNSYQQGDEFQDDAHPQAPWQVVTVDLEHRRVLLSRSGVTAALPLYKGLGEGPFISKAPIAAESAQPADAGLNVQRRTRDEVILDLRTQGLKEADILAVVEELDRQLVESGESPVKSLGRLVETPPEAEGQPRPRRAPPAGMEAILKIMEAQSRKAEAAKTDTSKDKSPESTPNEKKPD